MPGTCKNQLDLDNGLSPALRKPLFEPMVMIIILGNVYCTYYQHTMYMRVSTEDPALLIEANYQLYEALIINIRKLDITRGIELADCL